jgi:nucleotide-sensitive chloride channel 1A
MPSAILITSLPHFISRDEHKVIAAQTPVSFSDIPPVLRHKEEHVSATLDPPLAGFSAEDAAQGTLFVLERLLLLLSFSSFAILEKFIYYSRISPATFL